MNLTVLALVASGVYLVVLLYEVLKDDILIPLDILIPKVLWSIIFVVTPVGLVLYFQGALLSYWYLVVVAIGWYWYEMIYVIRDMFGH